MIEGRECDFSKTFPDGKTVIVAQFIVAIYDAEGKLITNSNVDYYYSESGYNCTTEEEVANQYHENFGIADSFI